MRFVYILLAMFTRCVFACDIKNNAENFFDENLFRRVFKSGPKNVIMDFSVFLDDEMIGEAQFSSQDGVYVNSLISVLSKYVTPQLLREIENLKTNNGFVRPEDFGLIGINVKFDSALLKLKISVPIEKKKVRVFGTHKNKDKIPTLNSALFSGFLNTRFAYERTDDSNSNILVFRPALNFAGVVLEGEATQYKSSKKKRFHRDYTSLVYKNKELSYRGGDVFGRGAGYFYVPKLLGFMVRKDAPLDDLGHFYNEVPITLLRTSTIEIYINDSLAQTRRTLAPGSYILDDIPYIYGKNDVKIKIIDDTGREEFINMDLFFDSSFIRKGNYTFDIYIGYPEVNRRDGRYDRKNLIVAANVRYGIFHALEGEFGISSSKFSKVLSSNVRYKDFFGLLEFKAAYSAPKDLKNGRVFSIRYSTPSIRIHKSRLSFSSFLEKRKNFSNSLLCRRPTRPFSRIRRFFPLFSSLRLDRQSTILRFSASLSNILGLNFNVRHHTKTYGRKKREKRLAFSVFKYIECHNDIFSSGHLEFSFEKEAFQKRKRRIASLSCSFSLKNHIHVSTRFKRHSQDVYISRGNIDGIRYAGSFHRYNKHTSYRLNADYTHQRFRGNVSYGKSRETKEFDLGLESSLLFADGGIAVTKDYIDNGGFVIVKPSDAKYDVKVLNSGNTSGFLGGAVFYTSPNTVTTNIIEVADNANVALETDRVVSEGEYKRGAFLEVQVVENYMVIGYLKDENLKPIDFAVGRAINCRDNSSVVFFSNEDGKIIVSKLRTGKYRISLNVAGIDDLEIEILESKDNVLNLGDLIFRSKI